MMMMKTLQLPPVALPQAESPHKLDEEGAVDDVPHIHIADNNDEDSARPQLPPVISRLL